MAKADLSKAHAAYPSIAMSDVGWLEFFHDREGQRALGRILYDIYDQVKEDEEREAGRRRVGRRPGREAVSLDEVFKVVFSVPPSQEVFHVAVRNLMGTMSGRALASKVKMSPANFCRYTDGRMKPDLYLMEKVAFALKVHPSHFMEWRAMYVASLIEKVLLQQPNLSVSAYKAVRFGNKRALAEGRL